MYCCSRINHYAQLQGLSKISCLSMGNCRWAIKRLTVLQILPSFYLLIHEIPRRWAHKTAVWWLRSWGERGYLVPGLSQDVRHLLRSSWIRPCWVLHPSCSLCDHLSPFHLEHPWMDRQAVCLPLVHSFIMWLGALALRYRCPSRLGQQGNGREEPPPAQCSGVDMYEPASSLYHFRDRCLMPIMGEGRVSQSYCLFVRKVMHSLLHIW